MRRSKRFWLFMAAFVAASTTVVAIFVQDLVTAYAAPVSQHDASKYYPPLIENWGVEPIQNQGNATRFAIGLGYGGFLNAIYPQLGHKDIIPVMRVRLILPSGVELLNSGSYKSSFTFSGYWNAYHKRVPKSALRWQLDHGVYTWTAPNVSEGVLPDVRFWLSGQPGQQVEATAQGFYFKKVKMGRRRVKVTRPIPHAPLQISDGCLGQDPQNPSTCP